MAPSDFPLVGPVLAPEALPVGVDCFPSAPGLGGRGDEGSAGSVEVEAWAEWK